jgi:hypothetical protein
MLFYKQVAFGQVTRNLKTKIARLRKLVNLSHFVSALNLRERQDIVQLLYAEGI